MRVRVFQRRRDCQRRSSHEAAGLFVSGQQRAYLLAQFGIVDASLVEEQKTEVRLAFERRLKYGLNLAPAICIHHALPPQIAL